MAQYKVQIFDPKNGFSWVVDKFINENGELVDTGSVDIEARAEHYDRNEAEQIADFLRKAFAERNSHETVEVVE